MGGGHHPPASGGSATHPAHPTGDHLLTDPAIERWGTMREKTTRHFRATKRNFALFAVFGVAVPVAIYEYVAYSLVRSCGKKMEGWAGMLRDWGWAESYSPATGSVV